MIPTLSQSPTDPAFVQNPYPFYEQARAAGPFFRWAEYDLICTTSAAAVAMVFRDRRFGREIPAALRQPIPAPLAPFYAVEAHSMLELEPPRHSRMRSLVLRAFTSRRINALAPEIATLCDSLLDAAPDGPFDLLKTYAQPLPVIIIARLLGVPEGMADQLLRWSNAMVAMYMAGRTPAQELAAANAAQAFSDFLRAYIDQRRRQPADDLITHLIAAEEDGARLSTDEMISTCILLLNAGHEATVHSLGNGVKTILEHGGLPPDVPMANLVEEILRFDPPLHMFTRYAYDRIEVMGQVFEPNQQIGLLLAAANRDPAPFDDPQHFIPGRFSKPHHSFGAGLHFCVGAPLARLELQIALERLFARLPRLRLTEPPRYANIYHFHGLEQLLVSRD
jgi:cytochrome P450